MAGTLESIFDALKDHPRLLIKAELWPVQGDRFQPTGFPDLGAGAYKLVDGTPMLLVESAQSMANRMEKVCWDEATNQIVAPLANPPLPHVIVDLGDGRSTNSLEEAHRLNSIYIIEHKPLERELIQAMKGAKGRPIDRTSLAAAILRRDPNSLLHGVFFARSTMAGGRARFQRLLSGFIEAYNVKDVQSGGVKNEPVDPTGDDAHRRYANLPGSKEEKAATKKALDGAMNVPYPRTEYIAERITAYFNFDLASLRGYRLGDNANRLLMSLALFKVLKVLQEGLKLRTACDLEAISLAATRPAGVDLSKWDDLLAEIARQLPGLIVACDFGDSPITCITAPPPSGKPRSKKTTNISAAADDDNETNGEDSNEGEDAI